MSHGGGTKCQSQGCLHAAAGKYLYCKEHLIMLGEVDNGDDMDDDEVYTGDVTHTEVLYCVESSLGKRERQEISSSAVETLIQNSHG